MGRRAASLTGITVMAGMVLSACGGSGGASGGSTPAAPSGPPPVQAAPSPDPSPSPAPAPSPEPSPTPSPSPDARPVVRTTIKIEYISCPATGEFVQGGPYNWTSIGCRIQMDLTAKDRNNRPTDGFGNPEWHINDRSLVYVRDDGTHTPVLRAEKPGLLQIQGELDGVKSNTIQIWLY